MLVSMWRLYLTFNFQFNREARSVDAKAFELKGKLYGSTMIPSYSSSHA